MCVFLIMQSYHNTDRFTPDELYMNVDVEKERHMMLLVILARHFQLKHRAYQIKNFMKY